MKALLFHTLWGWQGSLEAASQYAQQSGFDGLEANLEHPCIKGWRANEVQTLLNQQNQPLIVEITTGGGYTPSIELSPEHHLAELETKLEQACELAPLRINLITGSDCWPVAEQHRFLERCLQLLSHTPVPVSLETHRSRSLFNPWAIEDILKAHPSLRLTADVSHWCVLAERLMSPELHPSRRWPATWITFMPGLAMNKALGFLIHLPRAGRKLSRPMPSAGRSLLSNVSNQGNSSRSHRSLGLMATCPFTQRAESH